MKKLFLPVFLLLVLLCLAGCAAQSPAATPAPSPLPTTTPSPAPTPAPTPEPTSAPLRWTVTDESPEEILALAQLSSLREIDAEQSREYEALLALRELRPDCEVRWEVELQGARWPSDTKRLKVTSLEGLADALPYLPALEELDLLEAGATLEDLDRLYDIRPDVFYLWEFRFGDHTIRTDIPVYSSLQNDGFIRHGVDFYYPILKYCTRLRALDLGHNSLEDLMLIGRMKDLRILILADDEITDASPLAELHELTYLELFLNKELTDFSFLNELTKLRELNLCYCPGLDNLDFLANMPDFRFGLFKFTGVPEEHYSAWKERLPEAVMVLSDGDYESCGSGWRQNDRNYMIRLAFTFWPNIVRYESYDDLDFRFGNLIRPIAYYLDHRNF